MSSPRHLLVPNMGILDRFKKTDGTATPKAKKAPVKKAAAKSKKEETAPTASKKAMPANLTHVLVKPLVTEKAAHLSSIGQYAFEVSRQATRVDVRNAITAKYGVVPEAVNIQLVRGKWVRFGRFNGQRQTWKKAIVILPAGKSMDVHAGV